jgi:hypothetical protein
VNSKYAYSLLNRRIVLLKKTTDEGPGIENKGISKKIVIRADRSMLGWENSCPGLMRG